MPTLELSRVRDLLEPFYPRVTETQTALLSTYLDLLMKWNARTNLTSIRDPEDIVRRHFGESLFVVDHLPQCKTLLDLGSGAGLPGIPIQIALPDLHVTLAESQNKKAVFLREVVRTLKLNTQIWASRVEDMPPRRSFDVVTLRAVDSPDIALEAAYQRLTSGGTIAHLTSHAEGHATCIPLPGATRTCLHLIR